MVKKTAHLSKIIGKREIDMLENPDENLKNIYKVLGIHARNITKDNIDDIFIYIELNEDDGSYSIYHAAFRNEISQVRYYRTSEDVIDLAREAWDAAPANKRWSIMEFDVRGEDFEVTLRYPEEVDPEGDPMERRQAALDRRYGDKPIIWPPVPE